MSDTSNELRSRQAPLKERYRGDAATAVIVLKASATLDAAGVACKVDTGRAHIEAGLHPATGGSGIQVCSGDMLLEALAACAGVTLRAVATALDIPLRDGRIEVEGDLDVRGTLGVSKEAPVGFRAVRIRFLLDTSANPEQMATLLKLTERYCVVLQTLRTPPSLTATMTGA